MSAEKPSKIGEKSSKMNLAVLPEGMVTPDENGCSSISVWKNKFETILPTSTLLQIFGLLQHPVREFYT